MGTRDRKRQDKRRPAEAAADASPRAAGPTRRHWTIASVAIVAGAIAVGMFTLPGTSNGGLTASARPEHGKALYQQYCAACHGSNGQGEFQWQYRPRGAPALDSSGHAWHHEDAQLLSMILDKPVPDSRMPPWRGVLSREDALDLIAYIKSLWTPYIRDNCQGARHMRCAGHG